MKRNEKRRSNPRLLLSLLSFRGQLSELAEMHQTFGLGRFPF